MDLDLTEYLEPPPPQDNNTIPILILRNTHSAKTKENDGGLKFHPDNPCASHSLPYRYKTIYTQECRAIPVTQKPWVKR